MVDPTDEWEVIHTSPYYPPGACDHQWVYMNQKDEDGNVDETPSHCKKCGMSFIRYIFTECP